MTIAPSKRLLPALASWRRLLAAFAASLLLAAAGPLAAAPLQVLTEEWPPYNYQKDGEIRGISTAVVHAIQQRLGDTTPIRSLSWNHAYELALHTRNTVIYSTIRLDEREGLFKWVGPIATNDSYLFEHRDVPTHIHSLEDAKKVAMIAAGSTTNSDYIRLTSMGFTNLSTLDTQTNPAQLLLYKRAQLGVINPFTLPFNEGHEAWERGELVNTQVLLYSQPIYIAFNRQTDEATVRAWQQALDALRSSGELGRITKAALDQALLDFGISRQAAAASKDAFTRP